MKTAILIPARLSSSRLPSKMLEDVGGCSLIRSVWVKCCNAVHGDTDVFVVTDSLKIAEEIPITNVILTGTAANGTERCALAAKRLPEYDNFINVQGDMVDFDPRILTRLKYDLELNDDPQIVPSVVSVFSNMNDEDRANPSFVKVVRGFFGEALWFSRSLVGYGDWHMGIYGYSAAALREYLHMDSTGLEEEVEQLEQLRWLKNGINIKLLETVMGFEINTKEDLEKWRSIQ